jgi:hypothetical protein
VSDWGDSAVVIGAATASLLGLRGGISFLVPALIAVPLGGVVNAWHILVRPTP